MLLFSFPAIVMNIGADIAGMGAVGNLLFPSIHATFFCIGFTVLLLGSIIYLPYLFFWQANMEVEDKKQKHLIVNKRVIVEMKKDINFGMLFSNVVMFFLILTTGSVLFNGGIHPIDTVEQAAEALKPLAGNFAYLIFAVGVIGTGLLAIPVLSGSLSYIFTETFGLSQGLDKKFHQAKAFYFIIAISLILGLAINYMGSSPIKALIYSAILYGLTAPILIVIILHITNNKKIMGKHTNGKMSNILGFSALALMSVAAVVLMYMQLTENTT